MYFGQGAYETILPHVAWLTFLLTARTSLLSAAFCVGPINYSTLKLKVLQLGLCLAVISLKNQLRRLENDLFQISTIGEKISDSILTFKKTRGIS
jgi:hypothetical protein